MVLSSDKINSEQSEPPGKNDDDAIEIKLKLYPHPNEIDLLTWPCPEKPELLAGQPIGMYHCPYCGEMQLAGVPHLYPQERSNWFLTNEQINNMQPLLKSDLDCYAPGTIDKLTKEEKSKRTFDELVRRDLYWIFEAYLDAYLVGSLAYMPIVNPTRSLEGYDCDIICLERETQNRIDWGLKARGYKHSFNKLGGHRYVKDNLKASTVDLWHEESIYTLYAKVRSFPKGVGFIWRPYQTWYVEASKWAEYPELI